MIKAALFDLDGVVFDAESQYSIFWGMISVSGLMKANPEISLLRQFAKVNVKYEKTTFSAPKCPVYQNVDGKPHTDPAEIQQNLIALKCMNRSTDKIAQFILLYCIFNQLLLIDKRCNHGNAFIFI